jgi:large subunit ribosomal protein L18
MSTVNKNNSRIRRHARLRSRISGTSTLPRLSVFRSNKQIYAQLIDDVSGKTLSTASSLEFDKAGKSGKKKTMTQVEKAMAVGKAVAEKATTLKVKRVVFDRGGFRFAGRIKALAEAARTSGLTF